MEYKGLWEEETSNNTTKTIYKVTESYDWHNCDPDIITTFFLGKDIAESYVSRRMREIPHQIFGVDSLDDLNNVENPDGSKCIHDDNDYWTISIEKDEIFTSVFHCTCDIGEQGEEQVQKTIIEEHNRIVNQKRDYSDHSFYNTICDPYQRELPLFESEK